MGPLIPGYQGRVTKALRTALRHPAGALAPHSPLLSRVGLLAPRRWPGLWKEASRRRVFARGGAEGQRSPSCQPAVASRHDARGPHHRTRSLRRPVARLREQLRVLVAENRALRERVAKGSHTSHKPPTGDGLQRRPRSQRPKSGRKSGGCGSRLQYGWAPPPSAPPATPASLRRQTAGASRTMAWPGLVVSGSRLNPWTPASRNVRIVASLNSPRSATCTPGASPLACNWRTISAMT